MDGRLEGWKVGRSGLVKSVHGGLGMGGDGERFKEETFQSSSA